MLKASWSCPSNFSFFHQKNIFRLILRQQSTFHQINFYDNMYEICICKVSLASFPLSQIYEIPGKHFPNSSEKKQDDYKKYFQAKNFTDILVIICRYERLERYI